MPYLIQVHFTVEINGLKNVFEVRRSFEDPGTAKKSGNTSQNLVLIIALYFEVLVG